MSALLNLVEAATALTQLVSPTNWPPQHSTSLAAASAPASTLPATSAALGAAAGALTASAPGPPSYYAHTICDDDDTVAYNAALARMAMLRENHLQALRAAAAHAGLTAPPAALPPPLQPPLQPPSAMPYQGPAASPAYAGGPVYAAPPHPHASAPPTLAPPALDAAAREMFPLRLHALLSDPTVRDVISWLPHGRSFVVLRPDDFATRVLPRYFAPEGSNSLNAKASTVVGRNGHLQVKNKSPGIHKYPSFTRKLNRWGFRQIARGADAGAFCHEQFRRDQPELCRGMVCQKSRKLHKVALSAAGGGAMDDMYSVSSASTMGTKPCVATGEKRPFASPVPYSSTVTVSTAGVTSNKSLPLKKRKSGQMSSFMMNDIPSMISHRQQKMPASTASVTESDLTSDTSSVSSSNAVPKAPINPTAAARPPAVSAEAAAMEALARHFHQQHRAFALAALMENSRVAIQAAGLAAQAQAQAQAQAASPVAAPAVAFPGSSMPIAGHRYAPVVGAMTTSSPGVIAPTVAVPQQKMMSAAPAPAPSVAVSAAVAAKSALYKAYLQALSSNAQSS